MDLREAEEKAMAPHSSTLAWKIPWGEEPGGLQSMGRSESDMTVKRRKSEEKKEENLKRIIISRDFESVIINVPTNQAQGFTG